MAEITKEQMRERLGNIDQIRDLLFGHKIREYEQSFEACDRRLDKLEAELSDFQSQMRTHLDRMQYALATEIRSAVDSLDKKLKYLSLNTHEETTKLQEDLKSIAQHNSQYIESLNKNVATKISSIEDELSQTKDKLEEDIQILKTKVFEELEKGLSHLKETKLSRADLAELFFELCFKIKGTEIIPQLQEASDNSDTQTQAEFLLLEQPKE